RRSDAAPGARVKAGVDGHERVGLVEKAARGRLEVARGAIEHYQIQDRLQKLDDAIALNHDPSFTAHRLHEQRQSVSELALSTAEPPRAPRARRKKPAGVARTSAS